MFLTIKKIPKVSWSSEKPLNLRPKLTTFLFLTLGLSLFGIGEGLLLVSYMGASPWSVFAQGISLHVDYSIGLITFFTSLIVILFWVFLSQKPGIGTILNAIIVLMTFCIVVCLKNQSILYCPLPPLAFLFNKFLNPVLIAASTAGSGCDRGNIGYRKSNKKVPYCDILQ